jgi:hypothetical protein
MGHLARHNGPLALSADGALPPGTFDLARALAPRSAWRAGSEIRRLEHERPFTLLVPRRLSSLQGHGRPISSEERVRARAQYNHGVQCSPLSIE